MPPAAGPALAIGIPAAASLISGISGSHAQSSAEAANRKQINQFVNGALTQLSPENIASLTKLFLPHIMAQANPATQTSLSALAGSQARRGLFDSKYGATQETGLRANANNNALTEAFSQAFNLAGSRANAFLNHPIAMSQPNYNMAQGFQNAASQGLLGYALSKGYQAPSPYTTSIPGSKMSDYTSLP